LPGPTLSELILADDGDAIAGFRDAHIHKIRAYCEEACPDDLVEEARDAAFVDFLGRLRLGDAREADLDDLLLKATRGAAAGRFNVVLGAESGGRRGHDKGPEQICLAMPELLAAYANGELQGDERQSRRHLERCTTCAATIERMNRAERRFVGARGWDEPAALETDPVAPTAEEPVAAAEEAWAPATGSATEPQTPAGAPRPVTEEPAPDAEPVAEAPAAEPEAQPEPVADTPEPERVTDAPHPEPQPVLTATPDTVAPPAVPAPQLVRVRHGGLIGATRRLVGRPRAGDRSPRQ
jgi:hypothetical protein